MKIIRICIILICCLAGFLLWRHFTAIPEIHDFGDAKYVLENYIYPDHRYTIYCGAPFGKDKIVELPAGFEAANHLARANRVEWEHAVPAENFGRFFKSWREGHKRCEKDGKPFRGRKCASKVSPEFRKMEADLYNLFPAIGTVNAARRNYDYSELPFALSSFGSCQAKIEGKKFEPPDSAKGELARASLYMDAQYKRFHLSKQQKKLFMAWNEMYPANAWECERASRIERIQGNENIFIKNSCAAAKK